MHIPLPTHKNLYSRLPNQLEQLHRDLRERSKMANQLSASLAGLRDPPLHIRARRGG